MSELKQLIVALIRGLTPFEEVSRALDRYLERNPGAAPKAARLLQAARHSGLPHHLFVALNGQLGATSNAIGKASRDAQRRRRRHAGPAAAAGGTPQRPSSGGADTTLFAGDNPDVTLFTYDDAEATVDGAVPAPGPGRPSDAPGADPDATLFAGDDATRAAGGDGTILPARGGGKRIAPARTRNTTGGDGGEDTGMGAGAHGDATLMRAVKSTGDFDILGGEAPNAAGRAGTSRTGASWPDALPGTVAGVDREFHEGDLLRARFELISKLGEGGMGAVWKGKDKLKEEARDRNPYVAIKLLQGDFKAHPEAFIALQRETAKQQRLAHPNIATVYDFDRDDATATVFMTMEVLEGQPLDAYIRKLPTDGLPEDEAMPLIEQLCNGLSYAHQASLVHSDLKPSNCFFTKDGGIKLLDFGIARASKTKGDAEGETTLFDPGQLGALTPTYAAIEMFEGEDPDPRDDIFALAIMSYQLLTGKHPYGKRSALRAKELGLTPEPVAKLTKAQNRGLAKGLAFHREDRSASVEEFLDSITRKKSRAGLWVTGVATLFALAMVGAYGPFTSYLKRQERENVIDVVQQGGLAVIEQALEQAGALGAEQLQRVLDDERTIDAIAAHIAAGGGNVQSGLALLSRYPAAEWQQRVKEVDAARDAIFAHYEKRISEAFDPAQERFDFPAAMNGVADLDTHFPDSAKVFQLKGILDDMKQETLADMVARYKSLKAAGALVPGPGHDDIFDVLAVVEAIDPGHRLVNDPDLPFRFAEEAEKALGEDRDYARASALLTASARYAPDDPKLKGLRYDLDRILTRIENEKRIAELERRLGQAVPALKSLADYQGVRGDLLALAEVAGQSPVLTRIQARLKRTFDEEFARLLAAGEWRKGEALLFDFAGLLGMADLTRQRIALSRAEESAGFGPDLSAREARVKERVTAVTRLLEEPAFTADWERRLKLPYKELIALQPMGSPELEKVRADTARLFLGAAREARRQENFNLAREFVAKGLEFHPGLEEFGTEAAAIDTDELGALARRAERERLARIESLKFEFVESTTDNDVQSARRVLDDLRGLGVSPDDTFLTATAPQQLARAYQRLAAQAASNDDYLNAAEFARQALALDPAVDGLATALDGYEIEIRKREREIRLARLFNSLDPVNVSRVQQTLASLKADFPDRYDAMVDTLMKARSDQLRRYARGRDVDAGRLAARAGELSRLFPEAGRVLTEELADTIEARVREFDVTSVPQLAGLRQPLAALASLAPQRHRRLVQDLSGRSLAAVRNLEATDTSAASALARAAKAAFPDNRELAAVSIMVPLKEVDAGLAQMQRGQLEAASRSLEAARARDATHPDIPSFESQLSGRRKEADNLYARHVARAGDPQGYRQKSEIRELYHKAVGLCSDCGFEERQPPKPVAGLCHSGLAGFGSRRAGQCWDKVGRTKGPVMVVVPAGGGADGAFAIGKYEVSVKDFNAFCKATGKCKVVIGSRSRLPATGISAALAEAYARWLSDEASKNLNEKVVYRLPTASEWAHAASANGAQPDRKFNCRVTSGGNVIAGHDLVDARTGQENGWGLTNYAGNAQELVREGGGFKVRGGDFEVPLTRCGVDVSEPHDGAADPTTGFRLVRELG